MEPSQWRSTNRVHTFRHRTTERNYQPGRHILDHGKSNRRDQRQCLGAANGASANHIILDRVWLHGTTHDDTASAFNLNRMSYAALVDSYTTDFHCTASTGSCTDAHVVAGGTSSTPDSVNRITGNFLEASGENILYGGGGAATTPTDIEICHNHFFKPMTWMKGQPGFVGGASGNPFVVKNHLDLKNAVRVLVEGNIFENNWGGFSQSGYSILLTPKNQAGVNGTNLCSICAATDVTIRYNKISHSGAGISMANLPSDNRGIARLGERCSIHDITIDDIQAGLYVGNGILFQVYNDWPKNPLNQISIDHVTGFSRPKAQFSLFRKPFEQSGHVWLQVHQQHCRAGFVSGLVGRRSHRLRKVRCPTHQPEFMLYQLELQRHCDYRDEVLSIQMAGRQLLPDIRGGGAM